MRIIARFTLRSTLILLLVVAAVGANAKTCEKPFSKIFEESRSSVVQIFSVDIFWRPQFALYLSLRELSSFINQSDLF